jgi:hypothetical protein
MNKTQTHLLEKGDILASLWLIGLRSHPTEFKYLLIQKEFKINVFVITCANTYKLPRRLSPIRETRAKQDAILRPKMSRWFQLLREEMVINLLKSGCCERLVGRGMKQRNNSRELAG